jgi:hypothetical protein
MTGTHHQADVELVDGYHLLDNGSPVRGAQGAEVWFEGGFAHIRLPGSDTVQVISAPGIRRISYPA